MCLHVKYLCSVLQIACSDLEDFASAHQKFVVYLETITPYLQLRYKCTCCVPMCVSDSTVKPALAVLYYGTTVRVHKLLAVHIGVTPMCTANNLW